MSSISGDGNYRSTVIFEDSTFEANAGLNVGTVVLINGNVTFNRCKFTNNFANKSSGHVYAAYGTGRIHFKDCSFLSTTKETAANGVHFTKSAFLKSESGGPLVIENTSMVSNFGRRNRSPMVLISNGGYVHIDKKSSMECSTGSKLLFEDTTHFQYGYSEINGLTFLLRATIPADAELNFQRQPNGCWCPLSIAQDLLALQEKHLFLLANTFARSRRRVNLQITGFGRFASIPIPSVDRRLPSDGTRWAM